MADQTVPASDTAAPAGSAHRAARVAVPVGVTADSPEAGGDPDDLGGQADIDDGPESGLDSEPSVAVLRADILEKVGAYARRRWAPQPYVPGKTPTPYAGRIFDEDEVVSLVDAS